MAINLSAGATGNVPFALGFCFKQGHIPSGQSVSAGTAEIQATIKNRWPDGSAKFAVIAGVASSVAGRAETISLQASTSSPTGAALTTADLRATGIIASIECGSFGSATWSGADWDTPQSNWVSGPLMSSWIYRRPVGSDAHLVSWLEVRLFAGGQVEVLPWIENGYFDVAGPTNKSATYIFTLGGSQRFSSALDLPNHCRTPLVSGSALSHWLSTDPAVVAYCDTVYAQNTELVPTYFAAVPGSLPQIAALPSTYSPLQLGSLPAAMGSGGYDPSIGLLPEWDVLFLLAPRPSVWSAIQRNAYSAGRYGVHHRDETTNRVPRFSTYPTTVLGEGNGIESIGSSTTSTFTPNASGTSPATMSFSHHPSMGFMAYLVTGRWYHMETVQFMATANHFRSSTAPRENASGILQTWSATSTRGAAWGLRTLAHAACITPDSDSTLRTEFLTAYAANINRHHADYVAGSNSTLGWMQPYTNYYASVSQNAGAGSTATSIVLPGGTDSTDDYYNKVFSNGTRWTVTIGGQTRDVVDWVGATKTATVSQAFSATTANQPSVLRSNHWYEGAWQQDFYTAALGYSVCLGLSLDSATLAKQAEFFAWKAKSVVGRFGGLGASEYLYRDAASYNVAVAESDSWASWYSDWGKIWTDTRIYNPYGNALKEIGDGSLRGSISATAFWGNLQPALAYAVRFGVNGADAAVSRMKSAPNWAAVLVPDFNANPVWAVRAATP